MKKKNQPPMMIGVIAIALVPVVAARIANPPPITSAAAITCRRYRRISRMMPQYSFAGI